jgi:hypothetical protein
MNLLLQETCSLHDGIRLIPLSRGLFAKVWAKDYDWLIQWKWFAQWNSHTQSFYAYRHTTVADGKCRAKIGMARLILGLDFGDRRQAEHENHDTLDNCRSNLRIATTSQNQGNRKTPCTNTTGFKGASAHRQNGKIIGYKSQIVFQGEHIYLGIHTTPQLAHEAYCKKARELHGEFARAG